MANGVYDLLIRSGRGICPKCSGLICKLNNNKEIYNCIDCNTKLEVQSEGYLDGSLIMKIINTTR